jgi:ribosome-binding protein aMBF1 (putative translation factor)
MPKTQSKSKATNGRRAAAAAAGTVTLPRVEYERLLAKAGEALTDGGRGPALPKPDARGNLPAVEYIRASIARELIRQRHAAGLTQVELAARAGVRQETVSHIESGRHTVSEPVMRKIEKALAQCRRRRRSA